MSMPELTHHSGFLWPLDWFQDIWEGFWDQIHSWIDGVADMVWGLIPDWLKEPINALKGWIDGIIIWVRGHIGWWDPIQGRFVGGFLGWLWDTLNLIGKMIADAAGWVWEGVQPVLTGITDAFGDLMNWIWTKLVDIGTWITEKIWAWVEGSLKWLTDTFLWLRDEISDTGGWIVDSVVTAFNGAFAGIAEVFSGWPELLTNAIFSIFKPLFVALGARVRESSPFDLLYEEIPPGWPKTDMGWLEGSIGKGLEAGFRWLFGAIEWLTDTLSSGILFLGEKIRGTFDAVTAFLLGPLIEALIPKSPPKDIENIAYAYVKTLQDRIMMELEKVKGSPAQPELAIAAGFGVLAAMTTASVVGHTLGMAFDATHPIKDWGAQEMITHLEYNLLSSTFGSPILQLPVAIGILAPMHQAYNAIFRPTIPSAGQADQMLFEGHISEENWRKIYEYWGWKDPDIDAWHETMYREPAQRTLLTMLEDPEVGEDWVRKKLAEIGFTTSDIDVMIGYKRRLIYKKWLAETATEVERLRTLAKKRFIRGLDDEAQYMANLAALETREDVAKLWVALGDLEKETDITLDLIDVCVSQYVKGWTSRADLENDLITFKVVPEIRGKILAEADAKRLKAKREELNQQKKVMPEARVRQARDLGLISDSEYVRRLVDHDWTQEDARLDLQIELTPKPVTPEEIERRKRTVTSKRNRCLRRYELMLARVQDQIAVTAGQLDDTKLTMDETLDIIDTQIAIIDEELPVATPERAATLTARRLVLVQTRELQVTRFEARIRALTEQQTNLIELRDLYTKQRDEELAEYDEELKLLEVAG